MPTMPTQKEQIVAALQGCLDSSDFVSIGKLLAKYPEAGTYRLMGGSSVFIESIRKGNAFPLLIAIANGFDLKTPLSESFAEDSEISGMKAIDSILLFGEKQVREAALMLIGAIPEAGKTHSANTLSRAIVSDSSVDSIKDGGRGIFYHLSSSVNDMPPKATARVLSSLIEGRYFHIARGADGVDFARISIEKINDEALKAASDEMKSTRGASLIESAMANQRHGFSMALLERKSVASNLAGTDVLLMAKQAGWNSEEIAAIEHRLLGVLSSGSITDNTAGSAGNTDNTEGAESSAPLEEEVHEPTTGIRRKSMF